MNYTTKATNITVRFMTLSGKFNVAKEETFSSWEAMVKAIEEYAKGGNYSNVKCIDEGEGIRFTARTPGGRGGRNIAFVDFDGYDYPCQKPGFIK